MQLNQWLKYVLLMVLLIAGSLSSFAQTCNELVIPSTPFSRFELSGNEVKDLKTGLIWRRCSVGQSWDGSGCSGSASAYTWRSALALADGQWRLPNIKELSSLVERSCYDPAVNLSIFPNTASERSWSSSPYKSNRSYAWIVNFDNGDGNAYYKGSSQSVRLVRDEH